MIKTQFENNREGQLVKTIIFSGPTSHKYKRMGLRKGTLGHYVNSCFPVLKD